MQGWLCPSVSHFVPAGLCLTSSSKVLHAVRVPSAGQIVWKLRSPPHALEQAAESSGQCGLTPPAPMGALDGNARWSPACRVLVSGSCFRFGHLGSCNTLGSCLRTTVMITVQDVGRAPCVNPGHLPYGDMRHRPSI